MVCMMPCMSMVHMKRTQLNRFPCDCVNVCMYYIFAQSRSSAVQLNDYGVWSVKSWTAQPLRLCECVYVLHFCRTSFVGYTLVHTKCEANKCEVYTAKRTSVRLCDYVYTYYNFAAFSLMLCDEIFVDTDEFCALYEQLIHRRLIHRNKLIFLFCL